MQILNKIAISLTEPPRADCLWIRPVAGGAALYIFDGYWKILRLMNDHDTKRWDDDTPIDIHEGQLGPGTVGTEQIIDNSVEMQDLNDNVKNKIQKTYYQEDESLHMDYDVANMNNSNSGGSGVFNEPVIIEEEGD